MENNVEMVEVENIRWESKSKKLKFKISKLEAKVKKLKIKNQTLLRAIVIIWMLILFGNMQCICSECLWS